MLVRLDSRASTDSPFLGTGSDKVKGQSDVFYKCRYGTLSKEQFFSKGQFYFLQQLHQLKYSNILIPLLIYIYIYIYKQNQKKNYILF